MHFHFRRVDSLPRLSWCARLVEGSDAVEVLHGPWLEVRDDGFVEGAWDGPFSEGRFAEALALAGSGGRLAPGGVLFAAPSNLIDRLYAIRAGRELLISNSWVFLLAKAGDEPDPAHRHYLADFVRHFREGLRRTDKTLPTRRGRRVLLLECGNFLVGPDLSLRRLEKRLPAAPADFAGYVGMLEGAMARVFSNAGDPARRVRRYRPLATLSRGYDSTAIAALASRLGCVEAVTVLDHRGGKAQESDGGTPIGERLGMKVEEYDRLGFLGRPLCPEPEFAVSRLGSNVVVSVMEEQLVGALMLTGRNGDAVWNTNPRHIVPDLRHPRAQGVPGLWVNEFRLRVGFLHFAPPYLGAQHADAIFRITTSPEMTPWCRSGAYDRPIARRIAEEAGIPGAWFGQVKARSTVYRIRDPSELCADCRASFLACYRRLAPARQRVWRNRWADRLERLEGRLRATAGRLSRGADGRARLGPLVDPSGDGAPSALDFSFHWSFERLRGRYAAGDRATCGSEG